MGHGSGGRMTQELIERVFWHAFGSPELHKGNDFARLLVEADAAHGWAVSTDAHSISPLFFPGGDIGRLAVCGTVNDVAMSGARPRFLTAAFILEEGLEVDVLRRVARSMQAAAEEAGVEIVAGDTKVVQKGKGDGLFITTTGFGVFEEQRHLGGELAHPGDVVLVSGPLGDHGIAVLAARGDLGLEVDVSSDVCPLNAMIAALLRAAPGTHVLRDPTRGGLAQTLNEIAGQSGVGILVEEGSIPVRPAVRAACELLGLDPLYVANEGKLVAFVPPEQAPAALAALRATPQGASAVVIGRVDETIDAGRVLLQTPYGSRRLLDPLLGEMLPRIC
jgi:hydrogenase expression/formation protein HypE